ncbi:hypothetical protein ED312_19015 [Sinomicrobium pectinilyticum]|uniref:Uncharacterized protein n=1 Tax=Sinomicrobium pectinilyticum TaxID=1084421 RepID=A0A3N0DYH8_SINP1|nr:hypothetical protein [Sinomicrobium pectinilyticum]RNL80669.1 hypothetical protein ED312_19015 [Sinomicrobium pectinilyticum]
MTKGNNGKYKKLILGLVFDAVGYLSYIFPGFGEFTDVLWAPASAWLIARMYKGQTGKIAAVLSLIEELSPGLDVVPTFTLTWLYVYVFKKEKGIDAGTDKEITAGTTGRKD